MTMISNDIKPKAVRRQPTQVRNPSLAMPISRLLLFASGLSSLVFQVVWIRQLSTVVGVDVHAVSAGISAFMGGLAIGGLIFGRVADRYAKPLRLYALLEIAVALSGVLVTLALPHMAATFATVEYHSPSAAWILVLTLVTLPAVFMGGTLPALLSLIGCGGSGDVGASGGRLYAANTAGAIAGTLLASFTFIPFLGLFGTALAASACSLFAATSALCWRTEISIRERASATPSALSFSTEGRLAIAVYAAAGAIALGYEVVWTQSIVQFMSTRTYAFAVVLATYLAGLAAGAALMAPHIIRIRNRWKLFGFLIAGAGVVAVLEIAVLGRWIIAAQSFVEYWALIITQNELAGMCVRFAVASVSIVFLPTLFLGASFPVVLAIVAKEGQAGHSIGAVGAWNTIGGIAGSIVTGFVLIPSFGFVKTLGILALLACLLGLLAVIRNRNVGYRSCGILLLTSLAIACLAFIPSDRFARLMPGAQKGELVFYEEGLGATVAVVEQGNSHKFRRLYIQGVSNSGDSMPSLRYMRLQALLPLIIEGRQPRSSLVIGLGTGITAGALLAYDDLEKRVVAELLPGVIRAAQSFAGNARAPMDPRLDIRLRDGRRELLGSEESYDLITLEPPPPSASGVANLYSKDFYRLAAERLNRGGLIAQWLPLPTQNEQETRALVRSFIDVFPYATLWTTELHEMMLVGSMQPMPLDYERMSERFAKPDVQKVLGEVGIPSLAALMATWVTDRNGLREFAGEAAAVTDDNPSIEYGGWASQDAFQTVLPQLMRFAGEPPVKNAPANFVEAERRERQLLYAFYQAGLSAYRGDQDNWQRNGSFVMNNAPDNPYYVWFFAEAAQ